MSSSSLLQHNDNIIMCSWRYKPYNNIAVYTSNALLFYFVAPAAFEESVRVCVDCNEELDKLVSQPSATDTGAPTDRGAPPLST